MIGERLGQWVIFKELGRGGMGQVYLAQEEMSGRQAAIKVLAPELAVETGFLERFHREIKTLSQLSHPCIVRFYESGYENGIYYYAHNRTLAVKPGYIVTSGQVIATVGRSGKNAAEARSPTHLHIMFLAIGDDGYPHSRNVYDDLIRFARKGDR